MRSEPKHLPEHDLAPTGGWGGARTLDLSYQQAVTATVLQVVEADI